MRILVAQCPLSSAQALSSLEEGETELVAVESSQAVLEAIELAEAAAGSGAEARASGGFDLLVVDSAIAGCLELCRAVRSRSDLPILLLTGEDAYAEELGGLRAGATAFVARAASEDLIRRRARGVLRAHSIERGGEGAELRGARILAIDGDAGYLKALAGVLEREGARLDTATSGREGIARIAGALYDCVIVDMTMAELDGIAVCRAIDQLRQAASEPTALLMLSDRDSTEDIRARVTALMRQKLAHEERERIAGAQRAAAEAKAALSEELQRAKIEAERSSLEKGNFLAHMSHELRTPLNAIIGYSELIEEEVGEDGSTSLLEDVRRIQTSAKHLLGLINDILDLSRIERGVLSVTLEPIDLRVLMAEVLETVYPLAEKNGNRIHLNVEPGVETVESDATKLKQVLINLLSNAAKFTKDGSITARVYLGQAEVVSFEVADTGIGMTPEQMERIFRPYTQAEVGIERKYGGTGLGLAISRSLVELLGGDISCESALGKGSVFRMNMPVRQRRRS